MAVRLRSILVAGVASAALVWLFTGTAPAASEDTGKDTYDWKLPKGFPKPYVPPDNPMTAAKVELGRYLFYDTRMSVNGTESCATCHKQELAFTDGRPVGVGSTGEHHSRSAMSLVNVAYSAALTWSNPQMKFLEEQALTPMYGDHPIELGLKEGDAFLPALRADAKYQTLFARAFPDDKDRFTRRNVTRALASFERSIISGRSPYDRYHFDRDDTAIPAAAKHGEALFFSSPLSCFRCHGGFDFSGATVSEANPNREIEFHNTGLYNVPGLLSYPAPNVGIYEYTKSKEDIGKFKAPTLRNIAVTAPYMHDGSIATLEAVLDHYAAGGRTIATGEHAGVGHDNPNKDPIIGGFTLSAEDRANLIAFLETLTDRELLNDPRFSNPWTK
jgi:cytochrome c peroxidase